MSKLTDKEPDSKIADAVSAVVKYASYPAGIVTGWLAGGVLLRNNIYKNFASRSAFGGRGSKIITGAPDNIQDQIAQQLQEGWYQSFKKKAEAATTAEDGIGNFAKDFMHRYEMAHGNVPKTSHSAPFKIETLPEGIEPSGIFNQVVNKTYRAETRRFFKDLEIEGPPGFWKNITRNQKVETLVFATTAAAITLGAMLAISDHKGLLARLTADKDQGNAGRN